MTFKTLSFFSGREKLTIKFLQSLLSVLALLSLFVFTGCSSKDPTGPGGSGTPGGGTQTEYTISAKVDGNTIQTNLGTALIFTTGGSKLSLVGIFSNADPPCSISINVDSPAVGTFEIKDGLYGIDDESTDFVVDENVGSGSIKINEFSQDKVTGTFEFTAIGIDAASGDPNGEQVHITEGSFDLIPVSN